MHIEVPQVHIFWVQIGVCRDRRRQQWKPPREIKDECFYQPQTPHNSFRPPYAHCNFSSYNLHGSQFTSCESSPSIT